MTQQTRRQFFKTVAATVAGAIAVGVAPRVVAKRPVVEKARQMGMSKPIKLWPIQRMIILDMQDEFSVIPLNRLHKELDEYACADYFWTNQLFSNENQNPKTRRSTHPLYCGQEGPKTQTWSGRWISADAPSRTVS